MPKPYPQEYREDLGRVHHLAKRAERARVYEIVLRQGGPEDVLTYIDGVLLADLWDERVIPREIRAAWSAVMADEQAAVATSR